MDDSPGEDLPEHCNHDWVGSEIEGDSSVSCTMCGLVGWGLPAKELLTTTFLPDEPEPDYTQAPEIQGWTRTQDKTPSDETEVLILVNGVRRIGWVLWETPSYEEIFKAFPYWDDPHNDGQGWEWDDVTHWAPLLSDNP